MKWSACCTDSNSIEDVKMHRGSTENAVKNLSDHDQLARRNYIFRQSGHIHIPMLYSN